MTAKDPLAEYNRRRDFKKTAEPAGKRASSNTGNRFIVQKHEATRLHWDFRLEADGVLKSWAVTKGPSSDPEVKRLAVRTEDHPMSYAEFEGSIPKGEYGGGTVMLWDKGTWAPVEGKSWKDIDKGHLHFTLDGEIVAYGQGGNPDFSALQQVLKRGHGSQKASDKLAFHAFDLIEVEGESLAKLPNIERKERLEALLSDPKPPIHVADHVIGAGEKLYRAMCDAAQEGIISKTVDGPYRGSRTKSWVKVKCTRRQEFVVIGWKQSSAKGRPFASLLLAQHEGPNGKEALVYKGNVGTGFTQDTMDDLAAKMARLERKTPPAEVDKASSRGVTWLTPKLVAEIAFAEFTADSAPG